MSKIKILSTKKIAKPERDQFLDKRFVLIEKDVIRIELLKFNLDAVLSDNFLIFTSKNAVLSVLQNEKCSILKNNPCLCVGEKTKELLEQNGFSVLDFAHYAEDLTKIITKKYLEKSFLFFCGNLRQNILPDFFKIQMISFREILVYQTEFLQVQITEKFDAILFFSPSGVECFLGNNSISDEICFCIGTTTYKALMAYSNKIILPKKPTIESLLERVSEYFSV